MTTDADAATGEQIPDRRVEAVVAAMRAGAERIKHRQVDEATTKLAARGDLPADQREVVETMAENVVDGLLAGPTAGLREAADENDRRTVDAALRVFDPDVSAVDEITAEEFDHE